MLGDTVEQVGGVSHVGVAKIQEDVSGLRAAGAHSTLSGDTAGHREEVTMRARTTCTGMFGGDSSSDCEP